MVMSKVKDKALALQEQEAMKNEQTRNYNRQDATSVLFKIPADLDKVIEEFQEQHKRVYAKKKSKASVIEWALYYARPYMEKTIAEMKAK
jgi:predicted GNAT superfamily acetyltransferase